MQNDTFLKKLLKGIKLRVATTFSNPYNKVDLSWRQVKVLKHLAAGKERSILMRGKSLHFISSQELLHGIQEIFLDEIYFQNLPSNAYILDCGANIGLSVIYLKSICPTANIQAFEPDKTNFALLSKNVQSFGLTNVICNEAAVWNANTTLNFSSDGSMSSRINDEDNFSQNASNVKAVRLKDYINQKIHFLKIDIEGAEFKVLEDIADSLHQVDKMFVEYHGSYGQNSELIKIFSIIREGGFKFYIKEAASVYDKPFSVEKQISGDWDVQLNIFCFR